MQNGIEEKSHNERINSHPSPKNDKIQAIKKSLKGSYLLNTTCIKWWRLGDCLGFAPRSESSAFKPYGLVAPFLRYPDLRPSANPLEL